MPWTGRWMRVMSAIGVVVGCLTSWPVQGQQPEVATTVAFTEGPTVDRDGNVYFTDIITQRIMKLERRRRAVDVPREQQRRQWPAD